MKVTFFSRLFLVASIIVGLLFAWNAYSAQQTKAAGSSQGSGIKVQTEEIVQRFREAVRNMPEVFAIEAKTQFLMKSSTGKETKQLVDIKYYRDGRCVDIESSVHNYSLVNGKTEKTSDVPYYQRAMIDRKNRAFIYNSERKDRLPQNVIFWSDGEKVSDRISKRINIGRALEGYVAYDRISLIELLSDKASSMHYKGLEDIDGSKCHVLEVTIQNYGSYTLWLDPQYNCLPRKVFVTKKEKDIYGATPVSDLKLAHGSLAEVSYIMDSVKFKDFDGVLLPVACKTSLIWKYSNGKTAEWHGVHERLSIDLNPDFEALNAFEPDIPDGTIINHQEFVGTGIQFEWSNGEVVTRVDDEYLEMLNDAVADIKTTDTASLSKQTISSTQTENDINESTSIETGAETAPINKETLATGSDSNSWALFIFIASLIVVLGGALAIGYTKRSKHA